MAYKVKLEEFEGPLDLLLEIVEAKKFNVLKLSLSNLAEQFVEHLQNIPERNLREISSFISVGARLALLKSRELVPTLYEEENNEANLEQRLALYSPYRAQAKKIEKLLRTKERYYSREAFMSQPPIFVFPKSLTSNVILECVKNVLGSINHALSIPQAKIKETLSIEASIEHLKRVMQGKQRLDFTEFLTEKNNEDHVVHFIGLLELVRSGHVVATQKISFGTIEVRTHGQ